MRSLVSYHYKKYQQMLYAAVLPSARNSLSSAVASKCVGMEVFGGGEEGHKEAPMSPTKKVTFQVGNPPEV